MAKLKVRKFSTGATRDTNDGKLEFARFMSPAVIKRYAEYMHRHRLQSDGTMREPDNWRRGIDQSVYMDSLMRHVMELWQNQSGMEVADDVEDVLAAIMFNSQGMLFEILQSRGSKEKRPTKEGNP